MIMSMLGVKLARAKDFGEIFPNFMQAHIFFPFDGFLNVPEYYS